MAVLSNPAGATNILTICTTMGRLWVTGVWVNGVPLDIQGLGKSAFGRKCGCVEELMYTVPVIRIKYHKYVNEVRVERDETFKMSTEYGFAYPETDGDMYVYNYGEKVTMKTYLINGVRDLSVHWDELDVAPF